MVNCLGTVGLWGWAPCNLHGVSGDYLGEPTNMLVEFSNKNTNKQEVDYTLLIKWLYQEGHFSIKSTVKELFPMKLGAFRHLNNRGSELPHLTLVV